MSASRLRRYCCPHCPTSVLTLRAASYVGHECPSNSNRLTQFKPELDQEDD